MFLEFQKLQMLPLLNLRHRTASLHLYLKPLDFASQHDMFLQILNLRLISMKIVFLLFVTYQRSHFIRSPIIFIVFLLF